MGYDGEHGRLVLPSQRLRLSWEDRTLDELRDDVC